APDLTFKTSYSMPPHAVLGAIAPYLFWNRMPTWLGCYFGSVPLMLTLWWITAHRVRSRRPCDSDETTDEDEEESSAGWRKARQLSLFAAVLAALALWLAFGSYGKLYYLQTLMPLIGGFRAPARYINLTQLGLALVAAVAFGRLVFLVRQGQAIPRRHLVLPWLGVAASIVLAGWFTVETGGQFAHRFQAEFFSGPLILGAAAVSLSLASRGRRLGLYLLVFVAAADSVLFGLAEPVWPKACWWKTPTYQQYASASFATLDPNAGRLYDNAFDMNRLSLSGYRLMSGYAALMPARQLDYEHVNSLRVAEVAWYRHFVNLKTPMKCPPGLAAPIKGGWCKVPNPLPRARLLADVSVSQNPREDIKHVDIDATALVTHAIALPPSKPGTAALTSDRPGRIAVETIAPTRQLLTVSESYYPGWKVFVDDRPAPIERVNGDFMGCVVPEGRHCVRFEFAPLCLRVGKTISLASLALTVLLTGVVLMRRRSAT
ncbi:MAG: YfhO family protein, partial [Planctomycetaceae bacterium]|nr:YfhO family protein [Planctomycetaceae bacterium]